MGRQPQVDYSKYSAEIEEYCIRKVNITHKILLKYTKYITTKEHLASLRLEHSFVLVCNNLSNNGFTLNITKAKDILSKVEEQLGILDKDILEAFKPRLKLIRE